MSRIFERSINIGSKSGYVINGEYFDSARDVYYSCINRTITDERFEDVKLGSYNGWEGVGCYEDALQLLQYGYQPIVDKLKQNFKVQDPGQKRTSITNNIVGASPVVPLALLNVPNCMNDTKMKRIKCKVIDVYYDITCNSSVSSEDILKSGQKLLEAMLNLEYRGYRLNLFAIQAYTDSRNMDLLAVKIKSSDQPLDLKRISFPLIHTAFFRVIGFDWYSKFPKGTYRFGYGQAMRQQFDYKGSSELVKELFGKNALLLTNVDIQEDDDFITEIFSKIK